MDDSWTPGACTHTSGEAAAGSGWDAGRLGRGRRGAIGSSAPEVRGRLQGTPPPREVAGAPTPSAHLLQPARPPDDRRSARRSIEFGCGLVGGGGAGRERKLVAAAARGYPRPVRGWIARMRWSGMIAGRDQAEELTHGRRKFERTPGACPHSHCPSHSLGCPRSPGSGFQKYLRPPLTRRWRERAGQPPSVQSHPQPTPAGSGEPGARLLPWLFACWPSTPPHPTL